MSARRDRKKQGKTAHGLSLAQKLRTLHVAGLLVIVASCSDVDPLVIPPLDPDDLDADGVPNAADKCPEDYDPEQHDEDLDGFGDACDVCPALFDDQADFGETSAFGFGDQVGDACDPRPGRDGDVLARFDTFAVDTSDDYDGSGWTIAGDIARSHGRARFESPKKLVGDGLLARLDVSRIEWLGTGSVEVTVNGNAVEKGAACTIFHTDTGDQLIAREVNGLTTTIELPELAPVFRLGAWRTIDRERIARLRCYIDDEMLLDMRLMDEIPSGTYSFGASNAIADLDSISVYTFPVNPCFQNGGQDTPGSFRHACPGEDF